MSPMLVPSHSLPQTRSPQSVSQSDEASVLSRTQLDAHRALKSREERMVTPAMGAAMIDQMYSLRENGAQDGGRGFHLRLSTLQGARCTLRSEIFLKEVVGGKGWPIQLRTGPAQVLDTKINTNLYNIINYRLLPRQQMDVLYQMSYVAENLMPIRHLYRRLRLRLADSLERCTDQTSNRCLKCLIVVYNRRLIDD